MSEHRLSLNDFRHSDPPNYEQESTFESYLPAQDCARIARKDKNTAAHHRRRLQGAFNAILHDRRDLGEEDKAALERWEKDLWEILNSTSDRDWYFYNEDDFKKIEDEFVAIFKGRKSLIRNVVHRTIIVKKGVIVDRYEPGKLIRRLKLKDIRAGRISELDKTLGTILKLVGYDIISVRLINEWQVPIHQAIVVDNDSRHLMDTSLWRAVIVVLQKIIRLLENDTQRRINDEEGFLQKYPYTVVLEKMGIHASSSTPAYTTHHPHQQLSLRKRAIYQPESPSESDNNGRF